MATRRDALIRETADQFLDPERVERVQSTATTAPRTSTAASGGGTLTRGDGPPWPHTSGSPSVSADGTNHREIVVPRSYEWDPPRLPFYVSDPAREAPQGSELARKRARSRANSPVPCQTTYAKRQYGGNSRLDRAMDAGVCWHYNADLAERYAETAATMRRPDGRDGAIAFYDGCGKLRFLDRYGQIRPKYPGRLRTETAMDAVSCDAEPSMWDPRGLGKPADDYTQAEDLWGPRGGRQFELRRLSSGDADAAESSDAEVTTSSDETATVERDATAAVVSDDPGREFGDIADFRPTAVPTSTGTTDVGAPPAWIEGVPNAAVILTGAALVAVLLASSGRGRS